MKPATYLFPLSPVAASRPRVSRWGTYYSGPYRRFRAALALLVNQMFPPGTTPLTETLTVKIECFCTFPPTSKLKMPKPDVDNLVKGILDGLNGHLWVDDTQIRRLIVEKSWSALNKTGCFKVSVAPYKTK